MSQIVDWSIVILSERSSRATETVNFSLWYYHAGARVGMRPKPTLLHETRSGNLGELLSS